MKLSLLLALAAITVTALPATAAEPKTYDIVVYGGSSAGVASGIQAARMGRSVVVIEPTKFLGGLTTGGLGATDIGNKKAIGGISREFYQRVFKHYSDASKWKNQTREAYFTSKNTGNSNSEDTMWTFEPHVATAIFDDMLKDTGVEIVFGERLDLKNGVTKDGTRITQIIMESGRTFGGKMFIDATYEGDLMAKAGVGYHVGREANSVYKETINGIQTTGAHSHQFIKKVDPYIVPGDPKSGVIHNVQTDGPGEEFGGDKRIQAYNYRMCLTDVPENRVEWPKPEGYDPAMFELALRNVEAGDLRHSWNPVPMPNRKTDTNNNFAVSTDYIGMNYDYPEADYATRDRIVKAHRDYQMGLMWTYANSPRVPASVQGPFKKWGMSKDEFQDSGNWPRQLYVREARRMISEHVMTEHHCRREVIAEDSVGMGAYNMDSHHCQRYITKEGFVRNEGDIQMPVRPYPISFKSIRPKAEECTNLVVPICMSASHIAYGSIRMEPVFMVLGQSSATAASHAIEQGVDIQKIDEAKLKERLLADKQVLDFESPPLPADRGLKKTALEGVVVDEREAELHGFEAFGSTASPFVEAGYVHDGNERKGDQIATFKTTLPASGTYEVRIAYSAMGNRAGNVPVTVISAEGEKTVMLDQKKKAAVQECLQPVGTYRFESGRDATVIISNKGTNGHVIVDAVQWVKK